MKPFPEARHALQKFREYGYKIIFLTARPVGFEKQTLFCLLNRYLPYDEIIFRPSDEKATEIKKLAKKYNIVVFADDKASTCNEVRETKKVKHVYCVNQAHNKSVEMPEIKRVDGIFEIVADLKRLRS